MLTNAQLIASSLLLKGDREAILAKKRMVRSEIYGVPNAEGGGGGEEAV